MEAAAQPSTVCGLALRIVFLFFFVAHLYIRDSMLLLHADAPCTPHVVVVTCQAAPKARKANVQAIVQNSPWQPVDVMICENATYPSHEARPTTDGVRRKRDGMWPKAAQLMAAHVTGLTKWLVQSEDADDTFGHTTARGDPGRRGGCVLMLEDDAVVDWPTVQRSVRESNRLREAWDIISLYDLPSKYDEGWGRYYLTDRVFRLGCVHRLLAGKAHSAALLFSRNGASRVVGYANTAMWSHGGWDIWLGALNGEPRTRMADLLPGTGRQWLRVLRWGCTPAAVQHGLIASTLQAERSAISADASRHKKLAVRNGGGRAHALVHAAITNRSSAQLRNHSKSVVKRSISSMEG